MKKLLLRSVFALRFLCVGEVLVGSGSSWGGKQRRAAANQEGFSSWLRPLDTDIRRQMEAFRAPQKLFSKERAKVGGCGEGCASAGAHV